MKLIKNILLIFAFSSIWSCSDLVQKKFIKRQVAASSKPDDSIESKNIKMAHGTFSIKVNWDIDPENSGSDVLAGRIEWIPDANSKSCKSLSMIQIAKVTLADGQDYEWPLGQSDRNLFMTKSNSKDPSIIPGFYIDIDANNCIDTEKCSPYYFDSYGRGTRSRDGYIQNGKIQSSILMDYPVGWDTFEKIQLQTCAACRDDNSIGPCVTWGARWPFIGDREILPNIAWESPNPTFVEALKSFIKFYSDRH